MKNIIRKLRAAAILGMAFAVALTGGAIGAGTASASTVPAVYAAHNDGWNGYTKPGYFTFGMGGSPYFTDLQWTSWNSSSAWGTGKLWTQQPGCTPSYLCPYSSRYVGVYLSTIRWHARIHPYYARMDVKFYYGGKWRWDTGWFGYAYGGTVPWWQFPAVFPYL